VPETDPELFFPNKGGDVANIPAAKRVCMACEVRVECLNYALDNDERFGIYGGSPHGSGAGSPGTVERRWPREPLPHLGASVEPSDGRRGRQVPLRPVITGALGLAPVVTGVLLVLLWRWEAA
jgi:hypothetical protein